VANHPKATQQKPGVAAPPRSATHEALRGGAATPSFCCGWPATHWGGAATHNFYVTFFLIKKKIENKKSNEFFSNFGSILVMVYVFLSN
jgi:hypothetical protein